MDTALLVLQLIVGLLFVDHGVTKLRHLDGTAEYMESLGMRPGVVHARLAGMSEVVGGALIAAGLLVPLGALIITAVMVTATLTHHWGKPILNEQGGAELPVLMIAAVFLLTTAGGHYTLDGALSIEAAGLGWAAAALGGGTLGALAHVALARIGTRRPHGAAA